MEIGAINSISTNLNMNSSKLMENINLSLMGNAMNQMELNNDALTKMMEQSVNPNIGQNIDFTI